VSAGETAMTDRFNFLHTRYRYYGKFTPEHLMFNANLQEFAQQVGYISALETNGKLSPEVAFDQIQQLWHQLQQSAHNLNI
jgi:hypothetical protein